MDHYHFDRGRNGDWLIKFGNELWTLNPTKLNCKLCDKMQEMVVVVKVV